MMNQPKPQRRFTFLSQKSTTNDLTKTSQARELPSTSRRMTLRSFMIRSMVSGEIFSQRMPSSLIQLSLGRNKPIKLEPQSTIQSKSLLTQSPMLETLVLIQLAQFTMTHGCMNSPGSQWDHTPNMSRESIRRETSARTELKRTFTGSPTSRLMPSQTPEERLLLMTTTALDPRLTRTLSFRRERRTSVK